MSEVEEMKDEPELEDLTEQTHTKKQIVAEAQKLCSFVLGMGKLKAEEVIHCNTTFFGLGSGRGWPCYIMSYLLNIPSFGVENSPIYSMQSLMGRCALDEMAVDENKTSTHFKQIHCHFEHFDIMSLKTLCEFNFIFMASLG